ncbi:unnamed protein product [Victoria cruziana]
MGGAWLNAAHTPTATYWFSVSRRRRHKQESSTATSSLSSYCMMYETEDNGNQPEASDRLHIRVQNQSRSWVVAAPFSNKSKLVSP